MIRLLGMLFPVALIAGAGWVVVLVREEGLSPLPREVQSPRDNAATQEKVELGRLLFWDPILSGPKDVACATCHHPDFGYAERLDLSIGVHGVGLGANRRFATADSHVFVKRNSQTILNVAFNGMAGDGSHDPARAPMFWDLRATSLEAQALEPLRTFEEMRGWAYPTGPRSTRSCPGSTRFPTTARASGASSAARRRCPRRISAACLPRFNGHSSRRIRRSTAFSVAIGRR